MPTKRAYNSASLSSTAAALGRALSKKARLSTGTRKRKAAGSRSITKGRKRKYSRTTTKRGTRKTVQQSNYEYTASGMTYKRNLRPQAYINRLVRANIQKSIIRFCNVSSVASTGGAKVIAQYNENSQYSYVPVHAYEITSYLNNVNGAEQRATPGHVLGFVNASGKANWWPLWGYQPDGTTGSQEWQLENAPGVSGSFANAPLERDLLKWVSAKFILYGTNTYPVRYRVQLVRFTKPWLVPSLTMSGESYRTEHQQDAQAFWQDYTKRLTYSPIMNHARQPKGMVVLKDMTIFIDPKETSEQTPSPHQRQVNFFMRLNKVCNYDWSKQEYAATNAFLNDDSYISEQGDHRIRVHPMARLFLLITATAPNQKSGAASYSSLDAVQGVNAPFTTATDPSYDINLRVCHEQVE